MSNFGYKTILIRNKLRNIALRNVHTIDTIERSKTKTRITGAESPTDLVVLVDKISLVSAFRALRVKNRKEAWDTSLSCIWTSTGTSCSVVSNATEAWLIATQLPFRATREKANKRTTFTWSAREMVRALRRLRRHI